MMMRLGLTMAVLAAGAAGAQVTNLEAPGNLAATVDPGCVTMAGADVRLSPPDLGLGVRACVGQGDWDAAADLYALMLLRATFDIKRVEDASAHQAGDILSMQVTETLSETELAKLGEALAKFADPAGAQKKAFCLAVTAAGVPQHDPAWMIQHGMGAFLGSEGDGLVKGFDAESAWALILRQDMSCG
ncbi:MAG: hypothetical protein EAZ40_18460 [Rhodobacterales bacterium]|nr:MAG: hypothetical protein EAZ40_18460 [Rhodobacterales bacterium]